MARVDPYLDVGRLGALQRRPDDDYDDPRRNDPLPPNQPQPSQSPTPAPPPPARAPSGVPQDWFDDFVRRNPGDEGRAASAYAPTSHRTYDSQNPTFQPAPPANFNTGLSGAYHGVFNDPLTKQYEQLLQAQLATYQQQQATMREQAQQAAQRRTATEEAVRRLTDYTNQRVTKLQAPAYTGAEQEVLRTQLLDPLERDRQAARKRALETISGRGYELDSGVAQQLLLEVDRAFDEQRTHAQGTVASRQIEEQRSREQEAQQLLQYLAQLPDATARGDLDFVNYTQGLINQPGAQTLTTGQLLADLPTQRLNDALSTLGMSPSMSGANSNTIQLLQQLQNQRYMQQRQWADYFGSIGQSFQP